MRLCVSRQSGEMRKAQTTDLVACSVKLVEQTVEEEHLSGRVHEVVVDHG